MVFFVIYPGPWRVSPGPAAAGSRPGAICRCSAGRYVVNVASAVVMAVVGEYLCMHFDIGAIQVSSALGGGSGGAGHATPSTPSKNPR